MDINGKQSLLHKIIFEIRYDYGFAFHDKRGRVLNTITQSFPEWRFQGFNGQSANLINLQNEGILSYSPYKLDCTVEQQADGAPLTETDVNNFAEQMEYLSAIIIEHLGLKEFTRVGFRILHWFACKDLSDATRWIKNLGVFSVSDTLEVAFGGKTELSNFITVLSGEDRKYRIELSAIEQQIRINAEQSILKVSPRSLHKNQKEHLLEQLQLRKKLSLNPRFIASVDVDIFQEFPLVIAPDDFIKSSYKELTERLKRIRNNVR